MQLSSTVRRSHSPSASGLAEFSCTARPRSRSLTANYLQWKTYRRRDSEGASTALWSAADLDQARRLLTALTVIRTGGSGTPQDYSSEHITSSRTCHWLSKFSTSISFASSSLAYLASRRPQFFCFFSAVAFAQGVKYDYKRSTMVAWLSLLALTVGGGAVEVGFYYAAEVCSLALL